MSQFKNLLMVAKTGDTEAIQKIVDMYRYLIIKKSFVDNIFDDDLNQQLYFTVLNCVKTFKI